MKKYEVIVEDESAAILSDLLQSLPYVKEVKQAESIDSHSLGSEEAETKGSLDELFGLWKDRNVSLDKMREQQWQRKAK